MIYSIAAVVSWPAVRLLYRYRAYGKEHLPREGGFVLAAGHLSNFDPWPLGLALWPRRFLRFMAKAELFWFPLSAVMRGGGAFRVQRGISDREAVKTVRTVMGAMREGKLHVYGMAFHLPLVMRLTKVMSING